MKFPPYLQMLSERVCRAWLENILDLRGAVADLLVGPADTPDRATMEKRSAKLLEVNNYLDEISRDELRQMLFRDLNPPRNLESQHGPDAIRKISLLAVLLARLQPEGWEDEVILLQKRCGRENPSMLLVDEDWITFLREGTPAEQPDVTGDQSATGKKIPPSGLPDRIHEAAVLLRSFAPVVARDAAAKITTRRLLVGIFNAYGFVPAQENIQDQLFRRLNPEGAVPPNGLSDDLSKWPRTFVGTFAAELATAVDYSPSVWMLQRELSSIESARAARNLKNKVGIVDAGSQHPHQNQNTNGGSGDGGGSGSPTHPRSRAWQKGLIGLCFSGGGIRSATFNLGVLQGLAKRGLLPEFHYLSTVSGGGYIGSWLISWIRRPGMSTEEVVARLSPGIVPDPTDKRLQPIQFLRRFSNYLTPKVGALSVDTWVLGVVWLRNTLLNLMVLLPTLLAVLLVPRVLEVVVFQMENHRQLVVPFLVLAHILIELFLVGLVAVNLRNQNAANPESTVWYARPWWIRNLFVLPLMFLSWIMAMIFWLSGGKLSRWQYEEIGVMGFVMALAILEFANYKLNFGENRDGTSRASYRGISAMILIASGLALARFVVTVGLIYIISPWEKKESGAQLITVWGAPLVGLTVFLLIVLLVGLMGRNLRVTGTIWLGRLKAHLLMYSVLWFVWVGIALYGHWIAQMLWTAAWGYIKWPVVGAWVWTTAQSVMAGNDASTCSPKPGDWKTKAGFYLTIGPYVFIVGLMLALSYVAESAFYRLRNHFIFTLKNPAAGVPGCFSQFGHWFIVVLTSHAWVSAAVAELLLSIGVALVLSICIDVNEFSMSSFYRTRLARCYLGATNEKRKPMPFTGYDPDDDDCPLACFCDDPDRGPYDGPYPIYNATLNIVRGEELAWQERKGASFVFTPNLCGYETPWEVSANPKGYRNLQFVGYRETSEFAYRPKGVHLSSPMSISGAAVSPNMGSYSTAANGFLMTIFDVRLGWWLGNPRHKKTWRMGGPTQGLIYLVKELLGLTDDKAGFVYLSDGGHFENLAIYELVRRRCRYIVACDVEEDEKFSFQGLGNAIRKCREDFGVEIDIQLDQIKPDPATRRSKAHCVVGKIYYPDQPGWGYLVYLKSSIVGDEPADILEYQNLHPSFPHQSTGDQWFTESQFESYRRLGMHIATTTFGRVTKDALKTPSDRYLFFDKVWDQWYPPNDALEKNFTRYAAAYDAFIHELRSDPDLRVLDSVLFPQAGVPPVLRLVDIKPDPEKAFLFLTSLFQLMENVYLDLDLENTADHPDNSGWMEIFRKWTQAGVFKDAWQRCAWTYGRNFQFFCNRLFGLTDNNHS